MCYVNLFLRVARTGTQEARPCSGESDSEGSKAGQRGSGDDSETRGSSAIICRDGEEVEGDSGSVGQGAEAESPGCLHEKRAKPDPTMLASTRADLCRVQ